MKHLIKLAMLVFLIIFIVSLTIHPLEIPDENAHYASLNFYSNEGRMPTKYDKNNLSIEEYKVEEIFGIVAGENKYSYHPDFRIEQVDGIYGKYEDLIKSLNTSENRTNYLGHRAALYPPLYYTLSLPFHNLVAGSDILTRIFVSRLLSVLLTTTTILTAYRIGSYFSGSKLFGLTLAGLTLFYPMTTYVGSGINSDNLHNLLFALATYYCLRIIKDGFEQRSALILGVVVGLDLLTKPQAYILFPIIIFAIIIRWQWAKWRKIIKYFFIIIVSVLVIAGWQEVPKFYGGNPYAIATSSFTGWSNFQNFLAGYLHTHLREMPVWYWGVFKWFGLVLPRPWWWLATRLLALATLGAVVHFYRDWRHRKLSFESKVFLWIAGANITYVAALMWFDWQFYQMLGRSLGLQARYYMPLLVAQMIFLLYGLQSLVSKAIYLEYIRVGLLLFFVSMFLAGLYVQLSGYYDLTNTKIFIDQISQYKPWYAKGELWYLWFLTFFVAMITLIKRIIYLNKSK